MSLRVAVDPLVIAEDAWSYVRPWPNQVLEDQGDLVYWHGPISHRQDANVLRVRLDPGSVDRRIDEARAWMAARGRHEFTWLIGASTTPDDLAARLRAGGAEPDPEDPVVFPMVLDHEPDAAPGLEVVPVSDLESWARCREIVAEGYAMPERDRTEARARLADEWAYARADGNVRFVARLDGEPIAYAVLQRLLVGPPCLGGAATLPSARGRGAFRALLRACWEAAPELGGPAIVTLADARGRPVLEHLRVRSGAPVEVLVDHSDGPKVVLIGAATEP